MAQEAAKASAPEAKPKAEKQTNCPACNKVLKKLKRYYRNGKFYCSKKCYKTSLAKAKEEANQAK